MAGVKYKLNPAAFRQEILKVDFMGAEMEYRAERVKEVAEAIAPRDTGRYSRSFRVTRKRNGGVNGDRVAGVVTNIDPGAIAIEYGSTRPNGRRVAGHYTLTTALAQAGGHG